MNKDKLQFLSPLFLKYQADFEKNSRSRVFAPLAESYRKVGMVDKAMDILSEGIRHNPSYVMGYVGLAFCYFDLKQYNLAYSTLRPLVDTNRDNIRLQKLFADICLSLTRKEEALETYKYLLFINPKDREVAVQVKNLETEIEERYRPIHRPIIIPTENLSDENSPRPSLQFDIDKLDSTPKIDFDDWLQVDLKQKPTNISAENSISGWNMKNIINESQNTNPSINLDYGSEKPSFEKTEVEFAPIVTHTLVDLYCGQGHFEKALEILEKILILNPKDIKTQEKILEIQKLMGQTTSSFAVENNLEDEFDEILYITKNENLISINELENVSEEDGRRNLMDILDKKILSGESEEINSETNTKHKKIFVEKKLNTFLKKIKERALDYQNRL